MSSYPTTYSLGLPNFFFSDLKCHNLYLHLEYPCLPERIAYKQFKCVSKIHASCFSFLLHIQNNYICKLKRNKVSFSFPYFVPLFFQRLPDTLPRFFQIYEKYNFKYSFLSYKKMDFHGDKDCLYMKITQEAI